MSTPEVFRRFDEMTATQSIPTTPEIPRALMMALTSGNVAGVGLKLVNDLASASLAIAPELHTTLRAGREAGCVGAIISGSGPTVAFLTESESASTDLASFLSALDIAREIRQVTGPVPGATQI